MSIKHSEHGKRKHTFINVFLQHELKNLKVRIFLLNNILITLDTGDANRKLIQNRL